MMESTRTTQRPGQRETGQLSRPSQNNSNTPNERPGVSAPQGTPPNRRGFWLQWLIFIVVINLIFYAPLIFGGLSGQQSTVNLSYTGFLQQVQHSNVKDVTLTGNNISGGFKTPIHHQLGIPGNNTATYPRVKNYAPDKGTPNVLTVLERGAHSPNGVLLVGGPGAGKALLARAVAVEGGVPFFSASATGFVEVFVGVGASGVRVLFEQAKKNAPCIVFIDEIDAIGRTRSGASAFASNDEREQTLEQLLVELDGFETHDAIVVIAATNRPDVLDPALLRPGRFDRQVTVDLPERRGREAILRIHARNVPLAPDVNLEDLARATPGFSGADLENLVNEAALAAARRGKTQVERRDFEDALDKLLLGGKREALMDERERRIVAYHEGGHALVAAVLPDVDPLYKVTIVPRGRALGATQFLPEDDRRNLPRTYLMERLAVALGGRSA